MSGTAREAGRPHRSAGDARGRWRGRPGERTFRALEARGLEKPRFPAGTGSVWGGVWKSRTRKGLVWAKRPEWARVSGGQRPARFGGWVGGNGGGSRAEVAVGPWVMALAAGAYCADSRVEAFARSARRVGVDSSRAAGETKSQIGSIRNWMWGAGGIAHGIAPWARNELGLRARRLAGGGLGSWAPVRADSGVSPAGVESSRQGLGRVGEWGCSTGRPVGVGSGRATNPA